MILNQNKEMFLKLVSGFLLVDYFVVDMGYLGYLLLRLFSLLSI